MIDLSRSDGWGSCLDELVKDVKILVEVVALLLDSGALPCRWSALR